MSSKQVVRGALILTIAGLFSKVLGALYRVPLQNLTGDVGFYVYQQVYPFIGIVIILSLYGFPVAVSTLTTEALQERHQLTFRTFYGPVFVILVIIASLFFGFFYFSAPFIAQIVGDVQLTTAFQLIGSLFLFIPLLSLFRGVFQGKQEMARVAFSQMIEQFVRVGFIILIAIFVFTEKIDLYRIGEFAVIASMAGITVATGFLAVLSFRSNTAIYETSARVPWKKYISVILSLGMIASFNHLTLILMQLADSLTLVPSLMKYGFAPMMAMEWKGIFDRGYPLVQFGIVFGSSFALALIPTVVIHKREVTNVQLQQAIQDAMTLCLYISTGATVGLIVLYPEVNTLLFNNTAGTGSLQLLTTVILFTSLSILGCTILQTVRSLFEPAILIASAFLLKLVFNVSFVPFFSITGSALATVLSMMLLTFVVYYRIHTYFPQMKLSKSINIRIFFSAIFGMVISLYGLKWISSFIFTEFSRSGLLVYVLFLVAFGAFIYLLILIRYGAIRTSQLQVLPFSTFLVHLQKK